MIQPILFFALGFLCAGFLALLIAPAVWRRAVALTRKRVESSVPLTFSEIQAAKDGLRAEFAMSARKLEMEIRALRQKSAEQMVEAGSLRKALTLLEQTHEADGGRLAELDKAKEELSQREAKIKDLSDRVAADERKSVAQTLELERIGQMYDEASLSASNRQIELVARDAEMERVAGDSLKLQQEKKALAEQRQEMEARGRLDEKALDAERKKVGELDKKLQRMMTTLADRDDKLDRREKELQRLRQQTKAQATAEGRSHSVKIDQAIDRLDAERQKLEEKLTRLERENKTLKAELSSRAPKRLGADETEVAALREQMHELAAEVVSLTARLEGPDSPVSKALAADKEQPAISGGAHIVSLAERIKALKEATGR